MAVYMSAEQTHWLWALALGLVGYGVADLASGIVHWASDTYGSANTPYLGPLFIKPFRDHHDCPEAIAKNSLYDRFGASCLFAVKLILGCLLAAHSVADSWAVAALLSFALGLSSGLVFAVQAHVWSHQERVPTVVTVLRRAGLVVGAEEHDLHHRGAFESRYCIATGWWNRPLDHWRVFNRLDKLIQRCRLGRSA